MNHSLRNRTCAKLHLPVVREASSCLLMGSQTMVATKLGCREENLLPCADAKGLLFPNEVQDSLRSSQGGPSRHQPQKRFWLFGHLLKPHVLASTNWAILETGLNKGGKNLVISCSLFWDALLAHSLLKAKADYFIQNGGGKSENYNLWSGFPIFWQSPFAVRATLAA